MATFFEEKAQELYAHAKEQKCIDRVYTDMQLFKEGVGGQVPFMQMMSNDSIASSDKAKLIDALNTFFHSVTQQFFTAFVDNDLFDVIYQGVENFEWLYSKHHITITSAVPLNEQQIQRILTKVSFKMNCTIDTYDTVIDTDMIAGVKVASQEFVVDSSVKAQLQTFQQEV